jgi:hypothetical protein
MVEQIGKYKILDDDQYLKIRYRYTISDLFGSLWFLLMLIIGPLIFLSACRYFEIYSVKVWIMIIVSCWITGYGGYSLILGLYNPRMGILTVDKKNKTIIIRSFIKSERIKTERVSSIQYEIKKSIHPRMLYSTLYLNITDKKRIDCFIIRSSIPFDVTQGIEVNIHMISRKIRNRILEAIRIV